MQHFKEALDLRVCDFMSLKKDLRESKFEFLGLQTNIQYSIYNIFTSTLGKPQSCMFISNVLTGNAAQKSDSPSVSRSLIYLIILICRLKAIILCQVCLAFSVIELWMQNTWTRKRLVRNSALDSAKTHVITAPA